MNAFFSAGVIVSAYVAGRWALDGCLAFGLRRSALARQTLAVVLGAAMLTPLLVILAGAGVFHVWALGTVGWISGAFGLLRRRRRLRTKASIDMPDAAALVAAIVFVIVATNGRDETLGAGRDQQIYAEAAMALSERGHASGRYSQLDEADRRLLRSVGGVRVPGLTRARNGLDQAIATTHPLGWPVWLALAYAMIGSDGLYAANAVVFAIGGLLLFLLLRHVVAPGIAVAATCFFLALPSSIWIAGGSLSEPLAMLLLLAVPLLARTGVYRCRWQIAAVLLAATLVRMDSALLIPALIAALMVAGVSASSRKPSMPTRRIAVILGATLAAALLIYATLFMGYLRSVIEETAAIAAATLALVIALLVVAPDSLTGVRRIINLLPIRVAMIAGLLILGLYLAVIRPTMQPFQLIQHVPGLDGRRDFREEALPNLAAYVSWPILLFSLGGVGYAVHRKWAGGRGMFRALLLVIGIGPALLYIWSPQVSPDHPWAIRRFVPTIIPYVVMFAALFVHGFTRRFRTPGATVGAVLLVAPYAAIASTFPLQQILVRENDGITDQIGAVANALPAGLIVALDADEDVSSALLIAYGKPVAIIASDALNAGRLADWIAEKNKLGHPAWLLHGRQFWRTGAVISDRDEWVISRRFLLPVDRPSAIKVATSRSDLILSKIDGLDSTFATRMFGGERIWGAQDSGFFPSEVAAFGAFRYTDGSAWIDVPGEALRDAVALKVDVFSNASEGTSRWMALLIDGRRIWTGDVIPGVSTLRIPIAVRVEGNTTRIEILSQTSDAAGTDGRNPSTSLGIGLVGIRPLRAVDLRANVAGIKGFRSRLAVVDLRGEPRRLSVGQESSFVLDVTNVGTEFWPSVHDLGSPQGAVQIALRWYERGDNGKLVGDNRWALGLSMLPGDETRVLVPLVPTALNGMLLAPGEYDVRVGLVLETVAFFADNGDAFVSIPVAVAR